MQNPYLADMSDSLLFCARSVPDMEGRRWWAAGWYMSSFVFVPWIAWRRRLDICNLSTLTTGTTLHSLQSNEHLSVTLFMGNLYIVFGTALWPLEKRIRDRWKRFRLDILNLKFQTAEKVQLVLRIENKNIKQLFRNL